MFTWNLPALIRNAVWFTLLCIALNWNFMAWFFIIFIIFVEMDEELTKHENYSDFYVSQLELYDFNNAISSISNGWNLEEQLRVFNEQNPELVQQYQKTFHQRIHELRKHPTKTRPQGKAKKLANKKEELRVKQEVFGYTEENYWDEQTTFPTNEYVEVINHISSNSMYEWYHLNGLVIPEQEYDIKNICLYHDKYTDLDQDIEYHKTIQLSEAEFYEQLSTSTSPNCKKLPKLYSRIKKGPQLNTNNLLYWPMSGYQKAKHNYAYTSDKTATQYIDKRANYIEYIKRLSDKPHQMGSAPQMPQLRTSAIKQLQIPLHQWQITSSPSLFNFKRRKIRKNSSKTKPRV